jgi:hypothetical protein
MKQGWALQVQVAIPLALNHECINRPLSRCTKLTTTSYLKMSMRIAVAGTCGLALLLAKEINDVTSHQLVILSRAVGAQVLANSAGLIFQADQLLLVSISSDIARISMSSCRLQQSLLSPSRADGYRYCHINSDRNPSNSTYRSCYPLQSATFCTSRIRRPTRLARTERGA